MIFLHSAAAAALNVSNDSSSVLFSPLPSTPHTSTPTHALTPSQDPTPLTISAHDIHGGSKDFTEYANSLNFTQGSVDRENELTTPKTTPTIPLRVRISTKKLREIQSPYESSRSSLEDPSSLVKGAGHVSAGHTHFSTSIASPLVSFTGNCAHL